MTDGYPITKTAAIPGVRGAKWGLAHDAGCYLCNFPAHAFFCACICHPTHYTLPELGSRQRGPWPDHEVFYDDEGQIVAWRRRREP